MGRVEIIGYDEPQNFPGIEPGSDADKKLREMLAEIQSLRQQLEEANSLLQENKDGWEAASQRINEAEQQLERLREALRDCIDHAEEGWSYASDYFREKWGAEEGLAKARSALAELEKGELVGMKPESLDAIREMERIDRAAELEKGEA